MDKNGRHKSTSNLYMVKKQNTPVSPSPNRGSSSNLADLSMNVSMRQNLAQSLCSPMAVDNKDRQASNAIAANLFNL